MTILIIILNNYNLNFERKIPSMYMNSPSGRPIINKRPIDVKITEPIYAGNPRLKRFSAIFPI